MIALFRLVIALTIIGLTDGAAAQTISEQCVRGAAEWSRKNYDVAYEALSQCRDTDYGRSFETDFMLGTAACRIPERRDRGAKFLSWVAYAYASQLTTEGLKQVNGAARSCSAGNEEVGPLPEARQVVTAGGRYSGKTYYWLDTDIAKQMGAHVSVRAVAPQAGRSRRIVKRGDASNARNVAKLAAPKQPSYVFSRFVIIDGARHDSRQLTQLNTRLEGYLDFFVDQFGMKYPENYIFVYLLPDTSGLRDFAASYHGMSLDFGVIGYSFRDDFSIAAVIPGKSYGSLHHELFHLVVRSNFGDLPPWLDEGVAALYEESVMSASGVKGLPNWRGAILARYAKAMPTVSEIIAPQHRLVLNNASVLEDPSVAKDQAVYAAACRYFALYLQETGKLVDTYKAVRDYSGNGASRGVIERVALATGDSIEGLNDRFRGWLASVLPPGADRAADPGPDRRAPREQ
ncbi:exported hypothetical protein [Bradyrhizobium sp. ORS 375]|uniref:hypothetical protein n=1 Tax=Bradyrhizobium sp. (strain ORS 375) TaxID=566679 RepID=UPI000240961E|nr:hypothetical protein [Bradyrhizobium sp. ORS 375]CCD91623.1 exported hypothetical protein [Bradyrhizobium sp. ORS 375]